MVTNNLLKQEPMKKTHALQKFARRCSVSGKGMNEGWCWGDGESYTKSEAHTLAKCLTERKFILDSWIQTLLDSPLEHFSYATRQAAERATNGTDTDADLLLLAYHAEYVYWTDWHDEEYTEDTWYTHDGNEVQTINDNTL